MNTKEIVLNGLVVGSVATTGNFEQDAEAVRQFMKERGLWKKVEPGSAIFGQAVAFANAAAALHQKTIENPSKKGFNPAPFIVNSAFAIELYLKALARLTGTTLTGHDLVRLFERLPAQGKNAIKNAIAPCAANRGLNEPPNFPGYLSDLRDAFVKWRYCYELERAGTIRIEPTIFVMEVLHHACQSQTAA